MSVRTVLIEQLEALVAATPDLAGVRVVPSVRDVGALSQPVLIVKTNSLTKLPASPRSHFNGNFTLTLVSQHQDIDRAEDQLEGLLEVLLPALFTFSMSWESADQVAYGDSYLAYDITTNSIYKRE
jgi:hypothetical protein